MTSWITLKMNALEYCNFMKIYGEFPIGIFIGELYVYLIPTMVIDDAKEDREVGNSNL